MMSAIPTGAAANKNQTNALPKITDESSFQEMAGWLRELRKNTSNEDGADSLVIHVVGTKSDLVAEDPSRRRVPFERTIAYVADQLYPTQASTPPSTATATGGLGFGSGVFGLSLIHI